MAISSSLAAAYRAASYRVAGLELRIGRRSRGLDSLLAGLGLRQAMLLTAHNPLSRRQPARHNATAQARLLAALGPLALLPAESGAGRWREPQILAAGDPRRLQTVIRRFRQMAILRLRPTQAPELVVLR